MADIKLLQPQRLTDNADGGGLATSTEIVDGAVNNMFDDITRIDRVNGALSLRKGFAIASTADDDLYAGVHAIVQAPPSDPRVSVVMFETGVWGDQRADAQSEVERYLDVSVISRFIPYDRQLAGQRTVILFTRTDIALPEIGQVYALAVDGTDQIEYFRIANLVSSIQTFTDINGDYQLQIITLTIGQPLKTEFAGTQPNRFVTADTGKAVMRTTIATDATQYKGVTPLAADAAIGDLALKVDSVFAQLIPSTIAEVPVVGARPGGNSTPIAAATAAYLALFGTSGSPAVFHLPGPIVPGSMSVTRDSGALWHRFDDGKGNLLDADNGNAIVGLINYAAGTLTRAGGDFLWAHNTVEITYMPGGILPTSGLSQQIVVDISNRGFVYVFSLYPLPAPGSVKLSFRALGTWVELTDDGLGALRGVPGAGVASVDYETGNVAATLGAQPDIGSALIVAWGTPAVTEVLDGDVSIQPPAASFTLSQGNCEPGSLTVTWLAGVTTKTAADDGAGGFSGDATGAIIYSTGEVLLRPTLLANSNATFSCTYDAGAIVEELFTPTPSGGDIILNASGAPLQPGSVKIVYPGVGFFYLDTFSTQRTLVDDGTGGLIDTIDGSAVTGSIVDYSTGQVSWPAIFTHEAAQTTRTTITVPLPTLSAGVSGSYDVDEITVVFPTAQGNTPVTLSYVTGSTVKLDYKLAATSNGTHTESHGQPPMALDLTPLVSDAIVPASLIFKLGGLTYFDRAGALYHSIDMATGAGTPAGSIDYASGLATLTAHAGNVSPNFTLLACLGQPGQMPLAMVHGRTPGAPLRPGTFFIQANRYVDGVLVSGLADNNGNIDTADMHGVVDSTTGVFAVGFGKYVLDSSLTTDDKAEPWYDHDNVDGTGHIWRPAEVVPGSISFNCVVQTALPLNTDVLKINPARLPQDGKVQQIRPGDTLVIHDTLVDTMPNPLTDGQAVAIDRAGTMNVAVYDANGLGVPDTLWAFDPDTNEITFADPLDLTGYVQPLKVLNTVEDMVLCTDVQITGDIKIGSPLTHNYTADHSLVSGALIVDGDGTAQARYASLFDQATWTGDWSDEIIGDPPLSGARYNDSLYPIDMLNRDAIKQRWALIFTGSTTFNIVGEELGVIGTGSTASDCAPTNPQTGHPYFTLAQAGFGAGWGTGNAIRFNTLAAGGPIWLARTVLSGPATDLNDLVRVQLRWDKN